MRFELDHACYRQSYIDYNGEATVFK